MTAVPCVDGSAPTVWVADLDVGPDLVDELALVLLPDELQRAQRYHSPLHRDRFIVGRAIVRTMLAAHVGLSPSRLELVTDAAGKPRIGSAGASTHFSVSRSANRLLLALSDSARVGVDIERFDPRFDMDRITARYFSPAEQRDLRLLGPQPRRRASYACWTRKEAYLKGIGAGIGLGLDAFSVLAPSGGPIILAGSYPSADVMQRWSLVDLEVGPQAAAALAVETERPIDLAARTPIRLDPPYNFS